MVNLALSRRLTISRQPLSPPVVSLPPVRGLGLTGNGPHEPFTAPSGDAVRTARLARYLPLAQLPSLDETWA
jgi:hypothetical protein